MSDLSDLISAGDAWDAGQAGQPFDFGGGGFDLGSIFGPSDFPTFDLGAPLVPPVMNLPASGAGMNDLLTNLTRLIQVGYQGEAVVNQQKALNKIAQAQYANQLAVTRSTPTILLVLGIGAAGLVALKVLGGGSGLQPVESDVRTRLRRPER